MPAVLVVDLDWSTHYYVCNEEARDLVIAETNQKNVVMTATRVSGMASIQNAIFDALRRSLRPNAPLLLASLETAHPLAGAYAAWQKVLIRTSTTFASFSTHTGGSNSSSNSRGDVEVAGAATLNACVSCIRVYHLLRRKPTLDAPN